MSKYASILDAKLTYLYSRVGGKVVKLGLDTTLALMRAMEVDPLALPCIHVAGTNGKGSVAAMIEAALREAGLRTALYTSPHLIRFCERIRVGGTPIPDGDLLRLLGEVERADEQQSGLPGGRHGTFFELTTALAFKWFLEEDVQMTVLETGLGGRLDSTNVALPFLSVLTHIGMEHASFLGTTMDKVAGEKAGIIKPGRPVVVGRQSPVAMRVIEATARTVGAPVVHAAERVSVKRLSQDMDGQTLAVETAENAWKPLHLPLLGDFQVDNCAIAIAALEQIREGLGVSIPSEAIRAGLEKTRWPGRCQVVKHDPVVVVDVAHNPDAVRALAGFLKKFRAGRPVALICGLLADKDAVSIFRLFKPVVDACLLVPLDSERNMPMEQLMAAAQSVNLPAAESSIPEAVKNALKWAKAKNGLVVAAGSFHLVSAVLYELGVDI